MLDWLTDNKIPVGEGAEVVFDFLRDNAEFFFEGLSDAMDWLINAILWLLQTLLHWRQLAISKSTETMIRKCCNSAP